jgi:branched-subunit amino acid aminotransferase/4-amino-4-deoxychorismate lyase
MHVRDLASFEGVFVCNSHGVAPVDGVDDQALPVAPGFMKTLAEIYQSTPWDPI